MSCCGRKRNARTDEKLGDAVRDETKADVWRNSHWAQALAQFIDSNRYTIKQSTMDLRVGKEPRA
jgi:hypothetical protein